MAKIAYGGSSIWAMDGVLSSLLIYEIWPKGVRPDMVMWGRNTTPPYSAQ